MTKKIAVIIPCFNAGADIIGCIESLEKQDVPGCDYEIIVVDSSTDHTAQLVREKFPHLRIICSEERLFPGHARNIGARESSSESLVFIDADCVAEYNWLKNLFYALLDFDCDVVCGSVRPLTDSFSFGVVSNLTQLNEFMPGRKKGLARFAISGNMICRREVFFEVSGFPEDRFGSEDILLSGGSSEAQGQK